MPNLAELIATAESHRRARRLDDAVAALQQALAQSPDDPDVAHPLGLIAFERDQMAEAERWFRAVIAGAPGRRSAYDHLGNALAGQRRYGEAEAAYRAALAVDPAYAEAIHHLGSMRAHAGRPEEGIALQRQALALKPTFHAAWFELGRALKDLGRHEEAVEAYRSAVQHRPTHGESWNNLGTSLRKLGRLDEALTAYAQAIVANPRLPQPHNNLGNAYAGLRRHSEAAASFRRALALRPQSIESRTGLARALLASGLHVEAEQELRAALASQRTPDLLGLLATVLREQRRLPEARAAGEEAIAADPGLADSHNRLGNVLVELDEKDRAVACFRRAAELDPARPDYQLNLGNALTAAKDLPGALAAFSEAARLAPQDTRILGALVHHRRMACDWEGIEAQEARLLDGLRAGGPPLEPFALAAVDSTPEDQRRNAIAWMAEFYPASRPRPPMPNGARDRLRIGYLSSDLRNHAVGWLVGEVLERHDRGAVEVHAFATSPEDGSPTRRTIAAGVDRFVDVSRESHGETARRIREAGIDVLVELNGHTLGSRPGVLAEGAAPVQVTWLGFPGTLGHDIVDWALVDEIVVPPQEEATFVEKLAWLPFSYQPTDTRHAVAAAPTRAEAGLPPEALVLASFNNAYKLHPETFSAWMRILGLLPGSVLWLLQGPPGEAEALRSEARRRGVEPSRLVFAPKLSHAAHLARHVHIDLFLDNLPYGAHTTASDALWMGVPVITRLGRAFPGRVAASVLTALGVPELVTRSEDEYVALALRLGADRAERTRVREAIARQRTAGHLFDPAGFARGLESAYRTMWEMRARGEAPRSFRVAR